MKNLRYTIIINLYNFFIPCNEITQDIIEEEMHQKLNISSQIRWDIQKTLRDETTKK